MPSGRCGFILLAVLLIAPGWSQPPAPNVLLQRLSSEALKAVRSDTQRLRAEAKPSGRSDGWLDVRTAIHVHSRLSHDSRGDPNDIAAAAKKVGIRALFMTEHPTPDRKWLTQQVKGEKDGVLFIPGAELSDGLLIFRSDRIDWSPDEKVGPVLEKLNAAGGVGVICYPGKRTDWNLPPFPGIEIYNTHGDAETKQANLGIFSKGHIVDALTVLNAVRQYPVEAFGAIFDPPTANLQLWDRLTAQRHVTATAGNDSHANVGLIATAEGERIILRDPLGKVIGGFNQKDVPPFLLGVPAYKQSEKVLDVRFDPYEVSLGYVSTHLLAKAVTEDALFDALLHGRAYIAFDWIADPSGFAFTGDSGGKHGTMGDDMRAPSGHGTRLAVQTDLAGTIRLLRGGVEVAKANGRELTATADQPGAYRVEVSVPVAGQDRPWIYSNPIYVR